MVTTNGNDEGRTMPGQNSIAPVNTVITIPSRSIAGRTYTITKHTNGSWSCSCPAWKNQNLDPMARRCKHMEQVGLDLGGHVVGAYEAAKRRVGAAVE
jgi:hypothetical protein